MRTTGYEEEWQRAYGKDRDPIREFLIYPHLDAEIGRLSPRRLVDAGCGNGGLLHRYGATPFERAIGFDASPKFIEIAARENRDPRVEFALGDLSERSPVADGWAEVVLCVFVLNEVPSIGRALRQMSRMLEPSGTLLVIMTHPFQLIYELMGGNVPPKLTGALDYFATDPLTYRFTRSAATARYFHHNFQAIHGGVASAGLRLSRMVELAPDVPGLRAYPQYWEKRHLPLYLMLTLSPAA